MDVVVGAVRGVERMRRWLISGEYLGEQHGYGKSVVQLQQQTHSISTCGNAEPKFLERRRCPHRLATDGAGSRGHGPPLTFQCLMKAVSRTV